MPRLASGLPWAKDVLGAGFTSLTLHLTPDEPEVHSASATLVQAPRPSSFAGLFGLARGVDVLYVHGWSDYFFQTHVAQHWQSRGARFFALDLRRFGRNLVSESFHDQLAGYVRSLDVYDEDIEAALSAIGHGIDQHPRRKLILMGHSTGGLVLSLWAARHPGRASAIVLNSPWLELQTREIGRLALAPVIDTLGKYQPKKAFPMSEPGFYMRSLSDQQEGEWPINVAWHPERSFPVFPGWLNAVIRAQQRVAQGLSLDIPVFVMLSTKSMIQPNWDEKMRQSDVVLDVAGVAQRSLNLGLWVTISRIDGAVHDVFLSEKSVRDQAFTALDRWLMGAAQSLRKGSHAGITAANY